MFSTIISRFVPFILATGISTAAVIVSAANPGSTPGDFDYNTLTVNSSSPMVNGSFDIRNMFGGAFPAVDQSIFFDNAGVLTVYSVTFTTNIPIPLMGYMLYLANDGNDSDRAATRFQLFEGANLLSDVLISSTYFATYGSNSIRVSDTFTPVTGTVFTANFYSGTSSFNGVRVFEFDAVLTPEPAALKLAGIGGLGLLIARRLRRRGRQANAAK